MPDHNQKPASPRLEVGPEKDDGSSVCEVLLEEGSADILEELESVFDLFSRGTNCGMFRSDSHLALRPTFHLVERNISSERKRVSWNFEGSHVGYTAYRVLINLLRQMSRGIPKGLSVRINTGTSDGCEKVDWSTMSVVVLTRASHLPFNLNDEVLEPPRKQTVVVICTVDDVLEEDAMRISVALDAWSDVVMAGGLSKELTDGLEEGKVARLIEHFQVGRRSVECSVFGLECASGVFDTLINVLVFLHETVIKIESVEID